MKITIAARAMASTMAKVMAVIKPPVTLDCCVVSALSVMIAYINFILFHAYNLHKPDSSIWTVIGGLKGPTPTVVLAATVQL